MKYFEIGALRITFLSVSLLRLEEKGPRGFEDRPTFLIPGREEFPGEQVRMEEQAGQTVLSGSRYRVVVSDPARALSHLRVELPDGTLLWQFETLPANKLKLPAFGSHPTVFAIADTPRVTMPVWGTAPQPVGETDFPETNGWDTGNDAPDVYLFLPGGDDLLLRQEFVRLTGRAELPSLSAFGAWDSRYYVYTQESAMAQIAAYDRCRLPLDNFVVDTDWRVAVNGMGYDINESLFPDMQGFMDAVHARHLNLIFNDHPEPTETDGVPNHVLAPKEIAYRFPSLTEKLKMGLDGWWYDRNWMRTVVPLPGYTHEVWGMQIYKDAFRAVYPTRRLYQLSNIDGLCNGVITGPASIASHRYSIQWSGDTWSDQETILTETANLLLRGEDAALAYYSSDLMAHNLHTQALTDAQYLRWVQYGVLSPQFRLHVTCGDMGRGPWNMGEVVVDTFRAYMNLRYRLLPVFYALARENYDTGLPMARRMTCHYAGSPEAETLTQYTLGQDILVAPIIDTSFRWAVPGSWLIAEDGNPGLTARYYRGRTLSGDPVAIETVQQLQFYWRNTPPYGLPQEDFSAVFTGKLTVGGNAPITLQTKSDAGARLYVDGVLAADAWENVGYTAGNSTRVLLPGKTYEIRVEYFSDREGVAACELNYCLAGETVDTRSVWIPAGRWTNLFTGETCQGPGVYTVSCSLTQVPLFVRRGAVIPLAEETLRIRQGDWQCLTMDVYPGGDGRFTLYEDDTESTAYETGAYRTADITLTGNRLTIGSAQGSFDGSRACQTRHWTVRFHLLEEDCLDGVFRDGVALPMTRLPQTMGQMPFLTQGPVADGRVVQVAFTAPVSESVTLELAGKLTADAPLAPARTAGQITLSARLEDAPDQVNLTAEGALDWIHPNGCRRKRDVTEPQIWLTYDGAGQGGFGDSQIVFSWTDGGACDPLVTEDRNGVCSTVVGGSYRLDFVCDTAPRQAMVYLGGWQYKGRLELLDPGGKLLWETTLENPATAGQQKLTVDYIADGPSRLILRYTLTEAVKPGGNQSLTAAAVRLTESN